MHCWYVHRRGDIYKLGPRLTPIQGAQQSAITLYNKMKASEECQSPLSWTASGFSLDDYNIIILPGGHDKAVRQAVDSPVLQALLVDYFPKTRKPSNKAVGAICHGVLALSNAKDASGQSVIHSCDTTTLPGMFESSIFWGTRLFLGDYYKTYGAGSENVEDSVSLIDMSSLTTPITALITRQVRKSIKDDKTQFKSSILPTP